RADPDLAYVSSRRGCRPGLPAQLCRNIHVCGGYPGHLRDRRGNQADMGQVESNARGFEVMKEAVSASPSLLSRRHFFVGGALALTSAVAFAKQPQVHMPRIASDLFEEWVPAEVG